ncbi:uncharacterized protein [Hemitrygon akajei]|uniref:uncharacterized protein n=1 Tax=Hemitrygon akajei TaxID=2704970 RepID=UPI003BFA0D8A
MMPIPAKADTTFLVTEPLCQIPGFPPSYASAQLPPGTYVIPGREEEAAEAEREATRRRLRNLAFGQMASGISSALLGLLILFIARWQLGYAMLVGTPWWTGVISTVAGMLIKAVHKCPNKSTTIACLVANVICALACTPAVILYSLNVRIFPCIGYCYTGCRMRFVSGITVILLVNCLVSLVMSVLTAIANCRDLECCAAQPPVKMVVIHANQPAPPDLASVFSGKPAPTPAFDGPQ